MIASGFKYSGGNFVATNAPIIDKINESGKSFATILKSTLRERIKEIADVNDPNDDASLLVPSAIDGGMPVASNAGILINPPPPTTESINAAKKPKIIKMSNICISILNAPLVTTIIVTIKQN